MYGKKRPLETTIYAIRGKRLQYHIDIDSLTRKDLKQVYIKAAEFMKVLFLDRGRYTFTLDDYELENIKSPCSYTLVLVHKDGRKEVIEGKIIIVR